MTRIVTTCDLCGKEFDNKDVKDRQSYYMISRITNEEIYAWNNDTEAFEKRLDICPYCHDKIAKTIEELKR